MEETRLLPRQTHDQRSIRNLILTLRQGGIESIHISAADVDRYDAGYGHGRVGVVDIGTGG